MGYTMSASRHPIFELISRDNRYQIEAYQFVREALSYAQDILQLGSRPLSEEEEGGDPPPQEPHLTGQQLCEAIRQYALEQYGYMAKTVLNSWGVRSTSDFGEIVYNLISVELMKKSKSDRREDFDDVYDFEVAFREGFRITMPD
jgi:uncharacterized repeat protein (TIGR04138 family)